MQTIPICITDGSFERVHNTVHYELSSVRNDDAVCRELGIELLKLVSGTETAVARLCARCAASMSEINRLHELVSLVYFFY